MSDAKLSVDLMEIFLSNRLCSFLTNGMLQLVLFIIFLNGGLSQSPCHLGGYLDSILGACVKELYVATFEEVGRIFPGCYFF